MNLSLVAHPETPARSIRHVNVAIARKRGVVELIYVIEGDTSAVVLPAPAKPYRTEGLWQTTCLELFVGGQGDAYLEFNFAPSGEWAAYGFTGRREGIAPLELDVPPRIDVSDEGYAVIQAVMVGGLGDGPLRIAPTAVIEEKDGTKSYWAVNHTGDAPDFHDPACFVNELPAPSDA